MHHPAPHPRPAAPAAPPQTETPAAPDKKLIPIKSPTIGVFYAARDPKLPPLATVGTRVTPTTPVGQVEAMKTYTDILADVTGVIVEVVIKNGEPVEYNSTLFLVDPNG